MQGIDRVMQRVKAMYEPIEQTVYNVFAYDNAPEWKGAKADFYANNEDIKVRVRARGLGPSWRLLLPTMGRGGRLVGLSLGPTLRPHANVHRRMLCHCGQGHWECKRLLRQEASSSMRGKEPARSQGLTIHLHHACSLPIYPPFCPSTHPHAPTRTQTH